MILWRAQSLIHRSLQSPHFQIALAHFPPWRLCLPTALPLLIPLELMWFQSLLSGCFRLIRLGIVYGCRCHWGPNLAGHLLYGLQRVICCFFHNMKKMFKACRCHESIYCILYFSHQLNVYKCQDDGTQPFTTSIAKYCLNCVLETKTKWVRLI